MATLVTTQVSRAGVTPNPQAANAGGDACECGDNIFLELVNTNAAARNVTLAIPAAASTYPGVVYTSPVINVPATTGRKRVGPISALFKDPTTGLCQITYDAVANLTVEPVKLQAP
jgi:hypothetical protein